MLTIQLERTNNISNMEKQKKNLTINKNGNQKKIKKQKSNNK